MARLPRQLEDLARMLTYLLCHRPDEFGLVLAEDGFVPVKHLLQALSAEPGWGFVRRHHLEQLAVLLHPPAFELRGEKIRCLTPGPSVLRRPLDAPPVLLYAAIPPKAHPRVWEQGLRPPPDRELLLAATPELALKLGRRRGPDPVIVTVQAQAATRAGIRFQAYGEELFLAPAIPREFVQVPPLPPARPLKPKPEKAPFPPPAPGSAILDLARLFSPQLAKGKGKTKEPAWKAGRRQARSLKRGKEDAD